jgi:hypothetical protein
VALDDVLKPSSAQAVPSRSDTDTALHNAADLPIFLRASVPSSCAARTASGNVKGKHIGHSEAETALGAGQAHMHSDR